MVAEVHDVVADVGSRRRMATRKIERDSHHRLEDRRAEGRVHHVEVLAEGQVLEGRGAGHAVLDMHGGEEGGHRDVSIRRAAWRVMSRRSSSSISWIEDERLGEPMEDRPDVGDGEDAERLAGGPDDHVLDVEPVDVAVDVRSPARRTSRALAGVADRGFEGIAQRRARRVDDGEDARRATRAWRLPITSPSSVGDGDGGEIVARE